MTEHEAISVAVDGLVGDDGLHVKIRSKNEGLDRNLLCRVTASLRYLAARLVDREVVQKRFAGAFVDVGGWFDNRFYSEDEQVALRAAGRQLVQLAYNIFDPHERAVQTDGESLIYRGKRLVASETSNLSWPEARSASPPRNEDDAIAVVLGGLVGPAGIVAKLHMGQGFDRVRYERVVEAILYLTEAWSARDEVSKHIGVAFVDVWNLWHLNIGAYSDPEQELIQSGAMNIVELADKLLNP